MHRADATAQHAAAYRIMFDEVGDLEQRGCVGHGMAAVSAARQHAAKWLSPQACNGGYSARQRSIASGQRGAKAQPGGRLVRDGTMPGISTSRTSELEPNVATAGIDAIRPRV